MVAAAAAAAAVAVAVAVVEVAAVKVAADAASAPVSVVDALGTAVHRWLSIEVMENPAGRFAFVDMMKRNSDACRCREGINQPSRDIGITDPRRAGHQIAASSMALSMSANIEKEQKPTWEKTVECRWMKEPTGSTNLKHQRSDVSLEWDCGRDFGREVKTASRGRGWIGLGLEGFPRVADPCTDTEHEGGLTKHQGGVGAPLDVAPRQMRLVLMPWMLIRADGGDGGNA